MSEQQARRSQRVRGHLPVESQVVGEHKAMSAPPAVLDSSAVTIGEALEAAAVSIGNKPVEQSDAAAIQAAEMRATGANRTVSSGVAVTAMAAASANALLLHDDDKTRLRDVLKHATAKLPADKAATREDAEMVSAAEMKNNPERMAQPGGVAASVGAAARLNQQE